MDGRTAKTVRFGFLEASERFPDRPALEVAGETLSYRELRRRSASLAATLAKTIEPSTSSTRTPLTAVFGHRSVSAFSGVLGALLAGDGYVPLNPNFPIERTRAMLERSGCRSLIIDRSGCERLDALLDGIEASLVLIVPDEPNVDDIKRRWPSHQVVGAGELVSAEDWVPGVVDPNAIAYLLFTSGSTGIPKGVMVAHRNVVHFVAAMVERYQITEADRFSQTFDLTFDLSAFDMFVAWERGACLCVPTLEQKSLPAKYISGSRLTVWFSVPSTGVLMSKLRMLAPGRYPDLRLSLFCGEALPLEIAEGWSKAAPNSVVENLYGPTELTIACTLYRFDPALSSLEAEMGLVPIGGPYPGMNVLVVDEMLREVPPGETGELLLAGPQVSLGYWKDVERTALAFVTPPDRDEIYYRTGDRVRRPLGDKPITYLGRIDHQIKIQGYRVELGEIEAVVRREAQVEVAIALGWPLTQAGAGGVVVFIGSDDPGAASDLIERLKEKLPSYMVPSDVRVVRQFPLNANGKVDRKALCEMLLSSEAMAHRPPWPIGPP